MVYRKHRVGSPLKLSWLVLWEAVGGFLQDSRILLRSAFLSGLRLISASLAGSPLHHNHIVPSRSNNVSRSSRTLWNQTRDKDCAEDSLTKTSCPCMLLVPGFFCSPSEATAVINAPKERLSANYPLPSMAI